MPFWILCTLLSSLIGQSEQFGQDLPIKDVKVFAEETDTSVGGAWVLNVAWRDENNQSENVSYDIEVLYTEQMRTVHSETTHVKPYKTNYYLWKWTSPIPLQCTSHSVRLRRRNQQYTGEWTALFVHQGEDQSPTETVVYPREPVFMVGSNITFCCILKTESEFGPPTFTDRISNRTYITKPIHFHSPTNASFQKTCYSSGSSVFIGYPPDDQNLTCVTRDLSSVECYWELGRETFLIGIKKTTYTLNGSKCEFNKCGPLPLIKQVTNWTLIAKNGLGMKTLIDTADPTHRVHLKAPSKMSYAANARNVTLRWSWNIEKYASFPMNCQAILNGSIYNKTFNGVGLVSIDLEHLQPNANYKAGVRCGSQEHFYKWGDWSEIEFKSQEDIPEAVDVWIQRSKQNTYVVWKPLTQQQSHGIITRYELTMKDTNGSRTAFIDKELNKKLCYHITESEQTITVSAKNSAGLSPASTIIVQSDLGSNANISRINGNNGSFEIFWRKHPSSTCGYVVEWFPTYNKTACTVEWKKIPQCHSGACETWNQSGVFEAGVKYTISVYACTEEAPVLLQRSEGYAIEQRPLGRVQNLRGKQNGRNLELFWDEVPLDQQKGFIQGYKVKTIHADFTKETKVLEPKVKLTLDPGFYTFRVCAFTSEGDGDDAVFTMDMERNVVQMIAATVVGCSVATLVFIIITILCYRKRKWLKKLLYPDIPQPKLAGKWTTKGIYCTPMTEGYLKCEIQEVNSSESPQGLELINSKATFLPARHFVQNSSSSVYVPYYSPSWPCAKKLTSIIENPSYNMTTSDPMDVAQMPALTLEMDDSYLPSPDVVLKDYKPQSGWPTNE